MIRNISVIGIGKLGLCFSLTLEKAGHKVCGVDVNEEYVASINEKTFNSSELGVDEALRKSRNFRATTCLQEAVDHSDFLFVVVATPSLRNGRYDHSQINGLIEKLEKLGSKEGKNFVVCCTTMPGYCDSIKERLNTLGYTVSYNPEFIAQGTILRDQDHPDMVLIGQGNEETGLKLQEIYENHTSNTPRICRMTPLEAEITKISLNCFLTTKIAYANMIGDILIRCGGNPDVVLSAIGSDTRIGNKYLGYGFGYGGPCFPRDNRALAIFADDIGVEASISLASDKSNELHLNYQVEHFIANNSREVPVKFDFVTYKPESTLLIESQQLAFAVKLAQNGFRVIINERKGVIDRLINRYGQLFEYNER